MKHTLLIHCADQVGLIHKITGVIAAHHLNITANNEFVDATDNQFFMRTQLEGDFIHDSLMSDLKKILPIKHEVSIKSTQKKNIVLFVTKEDHCLTELLNRFYFNHLHANILAVVGNHEHLAPYTTLFNVPFHFISHENKSKEQYEAEMLACVQQYTIDYIVLAKYMRILSATFTNHYINKMINIHHSFLPAFKGANPYRQAYERGVKIIGATAHFVNQDLDEGPIIYQEVIPVDHSLSVAQMSAAGKDVEKIVLAKALQLVLDDRVFVYRNKTILL
jgi:formyltetrahydrofolate deformylase